MAARVASRWGTPRGLPLLCQGPAPCKLTNASPSNLLASGDVRQHRIALQVQELLATVAAASPGRLRYGGRPPSPEPPLSPARSAPRPSSPDHRTAPAVLATGTARRSSIQAPAASQQQISPGVAQSNAAAAQTPAPAVVPATAEISGGGAQISGRTGNSSNSLRSRQKAVSLGARPLLPAAAEAAPNSEAGRAAAVQACLVLSTQLCHEPAEPCTDSGHVQQPDSAAAIGSSNEAAQQLRADWGVFADPLEAAAVLTAAAASASQVRPAACSGLLVVEALCHPS